MKGQVGGGYKELATCEKPGLGGGSPHMQKAGDRLMVASRLWDSCGRKMSTVRRLEVFPGLPRYLSRKVLISHRAECFPRSFLVGVFYVQKKEQLTKAVVGALNGLAGL